MVLRPKKNLRRMARIKQRASLGLIRLIHSIESIRDSLDWLINQERSSLLRRFAGDAMIYDIKNKTRTVPPRKRSHLLIIIIPNPKMTCLTVSPTSATAAAALLLTLLLIPSASSFGVVSISVPAHLGVSPSSFCSPTCLRATTAESEAEALLRRARELKAEAAEAEKQVHDSLLSKKVQRDAGTDKTIDHFFPHDGADGDMDLAGLVQRIKSKRPSSDLLLRVVDRLHERECAAQGLAHVEPSVHHDHTDFHLTKSEVDEQELKRVGGLIDRLIDAAKVFDEEWHKEKVITSIILCLQILRMVFGKKI